MALDPSDIALIIDLILAVILAAYFACGKPRVWYRDRLGWVIFSYAVAVVALLSLIVYAVVTGHAIAEPLRLIVSGALGATLAAKIRAVYLERRRGRMPGTRPYSTKNTERRPIMSDDKLIPANAQLAAKRGFIRTTSQAYGTALAGGITVAAVSDAFVQATSGNPWPLVIAAAVTVLSPLIAGGASYFSILSRGIPADYAPNLPPKDADTGAPAVLPPSVTLP